MTNYFQYVVPTNCKQISPFITTNDLERSSQRTEVLLTPSGRVAKRKRLSRREKNPASAKKARNSIPSLDSSKRTPSKLADLLLAGSNGYTPSLFSDDDSEGTTSRKVGERGDKSFTRRTLFENKTNCDSPESTEVSAIEDSNDVFELLKDFDLNQFDTSSNEGYVPVDLATLLGDSSIHQLPKPCVVTNVSKHRLMTAGCSIGGW